MNSSFITQPVALRVSPFNLQKACVEWKWKNVNKSANVRKKVVFGIASRSFSWAVSGPPRPQVFSAFKRAAWRRPWQNRRSRFSKNIGDFNSLKLAVGLWLANLWSRDLLFARVFSKPPFRMPRRPWGRGWWIDFGGKREIAFFPLWIYPRRLG